MPITVIGRRRLVGAPPTGGGGGAGTYSVFEPVYTLPTGLTYNADTGLIEGAVYAPTYSEPATVVTLTDQGSATANMTALQNAVNTAASGTPTTIVCPAGLTYQGQLTLKVNNSGGWIYIVSGNRASLPALQSSTEIGTKTTNRVAPADSTDMPTFTPTSALTLITAQNGASKYWLRGLNLTNPSGLDIFSMCGWTPATSTLSDYPDEMVLDQLLIDGNAPAGTCDVSKAIYAQSRRLLVRNCYAQNIGDEATGADSQFFCTTAGPGPYRIVNNYGDIGGACEWLLIGGADLVGSGSTLLPCDIEVRGNVSRKTLSGNHKNHFEIKLGKRILIEGNDCDGHNGLGQQTSLYCTLTTQGAGNVDADTSDITWRFNKVANSRGGISIAAAFSYSGTNVVRRIEHTGNLIYDSQGDRPYVLNGEMQDITSRHNTILRALGDTTGNCCRFFGVDKTNVVLGSNVLLGGSSDVGGGLWDEANSAEGTTGFAAGTTGTSSFTNNLIRSGAGTYTGNQRVSTTAAMGFTDETTDDYTLTGASPGHGIGLGGFDAGVPFAIFDTIHADVA